MPKKRSKLRHDVNETAFRIVQAATGEGPHPEPPGTGEKNPIAVERGRKGGVKGGRARAEKLTESERKSSARRAAKTRWERRDS